MCISFERVSGKKNEGNVGELKGVTKMYRDAKMPVAIVNLRVELLDIDSRYQTEIRTERDLAYLAGKDKNGENKWDERKLLPLIGVPHWEEGKVYLVDGYGRWIASQMVDKEKYTDLPVQIILNAPTDPKERLKFEAELYAFQNKQVAKMTPIQKHGAMIILNDKPAKKLEQLCKKNGISYCSTKGNREEAVLGSYTEVLRICNIDDGKCAEYIFSVLKKAGFDRKANGFSSYMVRSLRDMYKLYENDRKETELYLANKLRALSPTYIKSVAVAKYPMLDARTATSLYMEDIVVEGLGLEQLRGVFDNKVVKIKKAV